jgi:hypothetical protein
MHLLSLSSTNLNLAATSCCNLLAVSLWTVTTDKFGRRTFITISQTAICAFLFIAGSLWWAGATTGHVATGTALVRSTHSSALFFACLPFDQGVILTHLSYLFAAFGRSCSRSLTWLILSCRLRFRLLSFEVSHRAVLHPNDSYTH